MINKRLLLLIGLGVLVIVGVIIFATPTPIPFSPLGSPTVSTGAVEENRHYLILGFAPYWNLKKISPIALASITNFAYFNLHLSGDGTIYTHVNRREEDPGYTNYKRILNKTVTIGDKPLTLTFMPIDQRALTDLLTSPTNRQQAIQTIIKLVEESQASGVNIDFEPLGDTPPSLRQAFTTFMQELHTQLHGRNDTTLLTMSIYPSAANRPRLWDLDNLAPLVEYMVVMTYDYTMPVTDKTGPNAPLRGANQLFENDIIKNVAEITKHVPPEKILLGIPFYGYEWETLDTTKYARTEKRGAMASLERIQKMLDEQTLELLWDRSTLTPYGIASTSGQTSQIYFENETSIALKLAFVKDAHLGGIAIWALGYEGENQPLWDVITSLNR